MLRFFYCLWLRHLEDVLRIWEKRSGILKSLRMESHNKENEIETRNTSAWVVKSGNWINVLNLEIRIVQLCVALFRSEFVARFLQPCQSLALNHAKFSLERERKPNIIENNNKLCSSYKGISYLNHHEKYQQESPPQEESVRFIWSPTTPPPHFYPSFI